MRTNFTKEKAIQDMAEDALIRILKEDREYFAKTEAGKKMEKLRKRAKSLEDKATLLYREAKAYAPSHSVWKNGDNLLTDKGIEKKKKLDTLRQEFTLAMTFKSGKEYELLQEFIKALKTL